MPSSLMIRTRSFPFACEKKPASNTTLSRGTALLAWASSATESSLVKRKIPVLQRAAPSSICCRIDRPGAKSVCQSRTVVPSSFSRKRLRFRAVPLELPQYPRNTSRRLSSLRFQFSKGPRNAFVLSHEVSASRGTEMISKPACGLNISRGSRPCSAIVSSGSPYV